MRQHYVIQTVRWLTVVWVTSTLLSARAQSVQPPQIQWQRVIDTGDLTPTTGLRVVKAKSGSYGVLAGKNLAFLSTTGEVIWTKPVPGSYADSSTNRVPVKETVALAPTPDGGFVTLALDVLNRYYVTKSDSVGTESWATMVDRADAGPSVRITEDALTVEPDGSCLIVGSYDDGLSYLTMTKLSSEGYIAGQWRVRFSGSPQPARPLIRQILTLPDRGYLLIGRAAGNAATDSKGVAIQVDAQYKLVWQQIYSTLPDIQDAVANPGAGGTYTAIGSDMGGNGQAITIAPNKAGDGSLLASLPGLVSVVSLVNDGSASVAVLDAAGSNNGDFRLSSGTLPATFRWTKSFGGSGADVPTALLATDDGGYLAVGTTTSTDGDMAGRPTNTLATWVLKLGNSPQTTTLRLLTPTYNCQTGYISLQTNGGDGSPVIYYTPGVTRANLTDNFGTVEQELRTDPKVITIQATQSGQTVSYAFDFGAYCRTDSSTDNPARADSLRLIAPTYNCTTGSITFHATGSDDSPIEYAAAGITGWTTNPNQFVDSELRTAYDAQPLRLMARQHGQVVTYVFNLKAACGRARLGVAERTAGPTVTILGNPARETALVEIVGAEGQSVRLELFDTRGLLVEQKTIEQANVLERQTFDLRHQAAGTLLLHTTVNGQTRTVRLLKQ